MTATTTALDEKKRGNAERSAGWMRGWRGHSAPFGASAQFRTGFRAGRARRVLAYRLGVWCPSAGLPDPGLEGRRVTRAYLAQFRIAMDAGCDFEDILANFPPPPGILLS